MSQEQYDHLSALVFNVAQAETDLLEGKLLELDEKLAGLQKYLGARIYGIIVSSGLTDSERVDRIARIIREERDLKNPDSILSISESLSLMIEEIQAELDSVYAKHKSTEP